MSLKEDDRRLLALVDAVTGLGAVASGDHLACHTGCSPCCFGPFAITQLDAWRLQDGVSELTVLEPERSVAVQRRAAAAVAEKASWFPSDGVSIFVNEVDESRFCAVFASAPCPALDPDTGGCTLYAWRPTVCRTYGPPIRMSGKDWPPCPLCFKAATPEEVEMARGQLDVDAIEQTMMETAEHHTGRRGMTTVAFAIGGSSDRRSLATRRGGSLEIRDAARTGRRNLGPLDGTAQPPESDPASYL